MFCILLINSLRCPHKLLYLSFSLSKYHVWMISPKLYIALNNLDFNIVIINLRKMLFNSTMQTQLIKFLKLCINIKCHLTDPLQ